MSNGIDVSTASRPHLSLVMPAYNEQAGIQIAIAEACEAFATLNYLFEIIVVDDGSSDATAQLVEQTAMIQPAVRLLRHAENRGYGAALRTGFEAARFDLIAFTDADGQFDLEDIERLVDLTDRYPVAVGFRIDRRDSWRRRFFSWGYNKLVRFMLGTGVRDCDCALKVFRREVLQCLLPESRGFLVNAEMLCRARRLGVPIAEVAVRHRERRHGFSKVSLFDIPRTLARLLPMWWSQVVRGGKHNTTQVLPFPPLARSLPLPNHFGVNTNAPIEDRKSA
jgi:glycosyltransferase involved in cell wall biosynthesis